MKWRHAQQQINAEEESNVIVADDKMSSPDADRNNTKIVPMVVGHENSLDIHEELLVSHDSSSDDDDDEDEDISVIDLKEDIPVNNCHQMNTENELE